MGLGEWRSHDLAVTHVGKKDTTLVQPRSATKAWLECRMPEEPESTMVYDFSHETDEGRAKHKGGTSDRNQGSILLWMSRVKAGLER